MMRPPGFTVLSFQLKIHLAMLPGVSCVVLAAPFQERHNSTEGSIGKGRYSRYGRAKRIRTKFRNKGVKSYEQRGMLEV